ncbi:MAG: hypothetical protein A2Y94_13910 [Caldithrix sp. RBG_13_44_9]|nr:MAG: hypothetical protein A2Y94_13910 [Caldithrix sp. RBG_13_44_9]
MKLSLFITTFVFLLISSLFAQTSRFEKTFRTSADVLLTGATIYIVNQTTGDSLQLTEHATRSGTYYRNSVAYGHYKIYVNGALQIQNYYFAAVRERNVLEQIDPDGNNMIDTQGLEDSLVTKAKLSTAVHQWVETSGGGTIYNNPDDITIIANPDSTLSVKPSAATNEVMITNGSGDIDWVKLDSTHLGPGSVRNNELAANAVTTGKIQNGVIQAEDLADNAVTSAKIYDGTITSKDIAADSVKNSDLQYPGFDIFALGGIEIRDNGQWFRNGDDWATELGHQLDFQVYVDSSTISFGAGMELKVNQIDSSEITNHSISMDDLSSALISNLTYTIEDYLYLPYPNGYDDYLENAALDSFTVTDTIQMSGGSRYATYRRITSTNDESGNLQIYHIYIMWAPKSYFSSWMWGSDPSNCVTLEYRTNNVAAEYFDITMDFFTILGSNIYTKNNSESETPNTWTTMSATSANLSTISTFPIMIDIEVKVSIGEGDAQTSVDLGYLLVKYKGK